MQGSAHLSVAPSFDGDVKPSSFPAAVRRVVIPSTVPLMVTLLISCGLGFSGQAYAEPAIGQRSGNAPATDHYAGFIREASQRFGIPDSWIDAVMAMESGGAALALSSQGAMGLMQVMPETWAGLRARYGLGADPYAPRDNILAGAAYLREMHDRYGSPGFLAAYNAGPARYDDYLATGRELPAETQLYVAAVAPMIGAGQLNDGLIVRRRAVSWQDSPLFAVEQGTPTTPLASFRPPSDRTLIDSSAAGPTAAEPQAGGLFVSRANGR